MPLISIPQAKSHLKLTSGVQYDSADLTRKVDQASAIIVDYLKWRGGRRADIIEISAANPTVITTEFPHGYANGQSVTIGGSDSDPSIDGTRTISGVTSTTFTVPVAVETAGTTGKTLVAWDEDTAPLHVQQAVEVMLTHLWEHRPDDQLTDEEVWKAIGRILDRSRDPAYA